MEKNLCVKCLCVKVFVCKNACVYKRPCGETRVGKNIFVQKRLCVKEPVKHDGVKTSLCKGLCA